jgi:hypothetical protein
LGQRGDEHPAGDGAEADGDAAPSVQAAALIVTIGMHLIPPEFLGVR